MPNLKHYPDKPWECGVDELARLDNGDYICQQKWDGWRIEIIKNLKGDIHFVSRHNKSMDGDVEAHLQEQIRLLMADWPNGSQLDGEWMSRRAADRVPRIVLFDLVRYNRQWLLQTHYEKRWERLDQRVEDSFRLVGPDRLPDISLVMTAPEGRFREFYDLQKELTSSEGVVIKAKNSVLVADRKESKKNPKWYKIKYRGASDGGCTMAHLRGENW